MSKEEEQAKEAARQRSNQHNRAQADHWQTIANEKQAEHNKLQKKIERLQNAKHALQSQINSYKSFESKLKSTSSKVSTSQFKGTLRDKFDKDLNAVGQATKSEENRHQLNLAKIDAKISQLQAQDGNIVGAIENALSAVGSFLAAIF